MTSPAFLPVPVLNLDAKRIKPPSLHARQERQVVWALFQHLQAHGWTPYAVDYGPRTTVGTAKDAMEIIFDLDEAKVRFENPAFKGKHCVFLVRGNSPHEVVCDYSFDADGADDFGPLVDGFDSEAFL